MKKKKIIPPKLPIPAKKPENNLQRIIELLEELLAEDRRRGQEISDNLHFLTEQVNNANIRLIDIERILQQADESVIDFTLFQGEEMAITGIVVGQTATFTIGLVPATNFIPLQSGPVVSADDPLVVLSAVDAVSNKFAASVGTGDTGTSFNATVSGVNDQGAAISHVFNIPIIPAPPVLTSVTDFSLDQDAPSSAKKK